jgi:hypothetical protein
MTERPSGTRSVNSIEVRTEGNNATYRIAIWATLFLRKILQQITRGAAQEQELWNLLSAALRNRSLEDRQYYAPIFEVAQQIILIGQAVKLSKDGHLGSVIAIRKQFSFLESDYGFKAVEKQPAGMRFSSGVIFIEIEWAAAASLSFSFGLEENPNYYFFIEDVLYMYQDQRYRT